MSISELFAPRKAYTQLDVQSLSAASLNADILNVTDVIVDEIVLNLATFNNQVGVPNAPINATSFYSSGSGNLSQTDSTGTTLTYATTASVADAVFSDGFPSVAGNLPIYTDASGLEVKDSGIVSADVILADGSVAMYNTLDMGFNGLLNIDRLVIANNPVVSNPPVGLSAFYSNGLGTLRQRNNVGTVVHYPTAVTGSVAGNVPVYTSTSGLDFKDSGISASDLSVNQVSLYDQSQSLAPAGMRDLWQVVPALVFSGGIMKYIESTNTLYSSDVTGPNTNYSLDGGLTWLPVVFDVAPSVSMLIGYNEAGLWVAVALNTAIDFSYTSVDGINFVSSGVIPSGSNASTNVEYSSISGLFVAGFNSDATHWVSTSFDGITWTPRVTSDFTGLVNFTQLAQNSTTMVMVGDSPLIQPIYSLNGGITWLLGSGAVAANQAIVWSEAKREFFATGASTRSARSSNGILWEDLGVTDATLNGVVSLIWVDLYSRYYCATTDIYGNYSMYSTADSNIQFAGTALDGAILATQAYGSVVYIPLYDRFILALDAIGAAYSTARPYDVKALSDNIRVRNEPMVSSKYSTYADVVLNNSVAETDISATGMSIGSLAYQQSQPLGMITEIDLYLVATSAAGDSLTIRFKVNGGLMFSHIVTIPALSVNLPVNIYSKISVRNGFVQVNSVLLVSGISTTISPAAIVYNRAIENTWSVTGQWGANVNQMAMNCLTLDTHFRNGT